ncbi:hypothetical protein NQ315_004771 [Exocentrus adspersus]|uniref:Reverse transcriptase zinc-binding domain-containing protein n=1 Tax=Exocentrus adspersus TaxID=1586481 RepID=A0AAV8W3A9_9CUCU|nr:hypothetical protein NQ315_004771 [Exocentrus adspersus]
MYSIPEPILGILKGNINGALSKRAYRRLGRSWRMNTSVTIGKEESPLCPECGEEEDTPVYFLGHCMIIYKVFGAGDLEGEEIRGLPWTKILTFIITSSNIIINY